MEVVSARERKTADHVVEVNRVDDGERPRAGGAKEGGVRVDAPVEGLAGVGVGVGGMCV